MTSTFWILSGLLAAIALALLLWPLLRRSGGGNIGAQASNLRQQLEALKSTHAAGLISDADFASRRESLSTAALALVDSPALANGPRPRSATVLVLVLLVALPLALVLLYRQVGNPNAIAFSAAAPVSSANAATAAPGAEADAEGAPANAPDLSAAADTLAAKLKDNPQDGDGWVLLARTYRATEQFAQSREAFEKALPLVPESADVLAEYAEVLGLATEPRSLSGEPEKRLDRALALDPNHQRALWLKGFARRQAGDASGAEASWQLLLGQMEPGSSVHGAVLSQLNDARVSQGKEAIEQSAPASAAASTAAASAAVPVAPESKSATPTTPVEGIAVKVNLSEALKSKVQAGAVLFVFARAENGPPMPLAIARLPVGEFPVELNLDTTMGMLPSMTLSQFERVIVGARISMSGNAQAQAGDLEGFSPGLDWRAAGGVEISIDKVH